MKKTFGIPKLNKCSKCSHCGIVMDQGFECMALRKYKVYMFCSHFCRKLFLYNDDLFKKRLGDWIKL